jgi:dihydroorotase
MPLPPPVAAGRQRFDLLLTGGRVIDPRHAVDAVCDVAIHAGRIAAVAPSLDRAAAGAVRDVSGLIVAPGLIDIHTHVYHKATSYGVDPGPLAQRSALATLVDAGSAGAGNFDGLRDFVIGASRTRILAYLNISFAGIFAFDRGMMVGEAAIRTLLSVDRCVATAEANRDLVVGVKVRIGGGVSGEIGLEALDRAVDAAGRLDLPLMTHIGRPPPAYPEILARLRPGDILTHCFRPAPNAPVDDTGRILPALVAARERGVLFDIGHGMGAFGFDSAEAALACGFAPDMISSDAHVLSIDGPAFDLLHTMSKLVHCGVTPAQAIRMTTEAPARALRRPDLGHLGVGSIADISLLKLAPARFPFVDAAGASRTGALLWRCAGTYLAGEPVEPGPRAWETNYLDR